MPKIRWSDNDKHFGPLTTAMGNGKQWGLVLTSGGDEDSTNPAYARLHLSRITVLWQIPALLLRPYREKKLATYWDAETIARLGRDWYWDVYHRQIGFQITDGALHLYFGKQTNEWPGSKSKVYFLPWKEWRHIRHSLYDLDGKIVSNIPDRDWEEQRRLEDACPVARFQFADYDGEVITATCRIEEREWKAGAGWFKWLSLIRKSKISRSLDLKFSAEVGKRKGSWKGGTIGHSIEMLPGELHQAAFRRYCEQNSLTFGEASE